MLDREFMVEREDRRDREQQQFHADQAEKQRELQRELLKLTRRQLWILFLGVVITAISVLTATCSQDGTGARDPGPSETARGSQLARLTERGVRNG